MKRFNTTAICIPEKHYMVDTSHKMEQIEALIENGEYFTINRARQYGKTTTFYSLYRRLKEDYLVLMISFEGFGDKTFSNDYSFANQFIIAVADFMETIGVDEYLLSMWKQEMESKENIQDSFDYLSKKIAKLCKESSKKIVLLIDEVDKNTDNQVFLHFLGMLRNKYIRSAGGFDTTFQSVILAGVYDVKNMKLKLRPDEEKKYNSPWNIAVDFDVDMSFSPEEIATMLQEYEADHHTGMDIQNISETIYLYTGGYPYLVSWICKWIDEQGDQQWNHNGILDATKYIINNKSTLIDSLIKNYENHSDLQQLIDRMILEGAEFPYTATNPSIDLGITFGIFTEKDGQLQISNKLFEIVLYNHIIIKQLIQSKAVSPLKSHFIENGHLNMPQILLKFQELMKAEYRHEDERFIETQGRLLFLCFLKPIINGTGFYYVEPETRNNERMDIVVTYGGEEHIIELKIWHGEEYRRKGIAQLESYMEGRNAKKGYLLSFSFLKNKTYTSQTLCSEDGTKTIYEVVV